ncbi:hypothetical protein [uncultured Psychroserpens sp.]|uniref:hypothetical protein n=1 Tax=uncultured Psychroserpens sp. TaxID=255436 RepID=UPI002627BCE7|nr:hypothetical protein [uncultured Psychroserpens sp.]
MKYISFIDQLGIDIDELSHIDSYGIMKLQKQLKAKAMLGDANNLGEVANLIDQLKDETNRQYHVFVEKHQWLKHLISGNHQLINQSEIEIDQYEIQNIDGLKYFLAPFLKENLKLFLSETLNKGKYVLILKVLVHNNLFSEENNQLVINFFKARLNYATVYLREKRLKQKEYPVGFIANKIFINCLNQYPDCFNEEIQELNSEIIDVYNSKRRNIDNNEFRFAAKAMVALSILDTSNIFLEETLKSNASIAREYTYPSRSSRRTGSGFGGWGIFVLVMLVIRVVLWVGKSDTSYSSYPTTSNNTIIKISDYRKNNINELHNIVSVYPKISENKPTVPLRYNLYDNPYKPKFHTFYPPKTSEDISRYDTYVTNLTNKELIMFMLYKNNDKAVYIPKNKRASLQISAKDTIMFYSGKNFVNFSKSSKFFKTEAYMSKLYIIDSINFDQKHYINVYPENEFEIIADKTLSPTRKSDSIHLKNIFYRTTTLNKARTQTVINLYKPPN